MDWKITFIALFCLTTCIRSIQAQRQRQSAARKPHHNLLVHGTFNFSEGYYKYQPPLREDGEAIDLKISMLIREISEVNEENYAVTIFMYLREYWEENRIVFSEEILRDWEDGDLKMLDAGMIKNFWIPDLYFWNVKDFKVKKIHDNMESLQVFRNKTVRHSTACEVTLVCPMEFELYPMDVHNCTIEMTSYSLGANIMKFNWADDPAITTQENWNQLPQFKISVIADPKPLLKTPGKAQYSHLRMHILFRRKIRPYVLQTYLPSFLFVCISWISFIVNPDMVPGRMVLLVTTLLTLVTMYSSVRANSPRATSLKAIEVWLIVCILFVFSALLEYSCILCMLFHHKSHVVKNAVVSANGKDKSPSKDSTTSTGKPRQPTPVEMPEKIEMVPTDSLRERKFATPSPMNIDVEGGDSGRHTKSSQVSPAGPSPSPPPASPPPPAAAATAPSPKFSSMVLTLDKSALILFPIAFFIFSIAYWVIYKGYQYGKVDDLRSTFNDSLTTY